MKNLSEELLVKPGSTPKLHKIDPSGTHGWGSKTAAAKQFQKNLDLLSVNQYRLYAENRRALLIVLQGIDAGGKDGTVRHVMAGFNPQGASVTSFKVPAGEEKQHDYLWRVHKAVPKFGEIGIFNRSHYEDVLVVRVHNLVPAHVWKKRYDQINNFEQMLHENGVHIVKFFLYIDRDEQKRRFEARIEDSAKNWKFSPADIEERKFWNDYTKAFEEAMEKCSKPWAPWYVIPANKKWFRNLAVSEVLVRTLEDMNLKYPKPAEGLDKLKFE
ncbi:MAG TPA: polyphosphate kinase 2 family protein [Bryobacteraceae bacterium]|jgi:PPK2 family polyphosphate:nucleotide phosphotransferase